ncbi:AMP-binding protein [Vibrio sp. PP-XX7]
MQALVSIYLPWKFPGILKGSYWIGGSPSPLKPGALSNPDCRACFCSSSESADAPRYLLVGGDRLNRHPHADANFTLVNNYGPTETTVVATSGNILSTDHVLHIGRPIANTQIYILDAQCQPVPAGVTGEIYIGGAGVARGYINPEQTAERFLDDPFSDQPHARMYRTGDLARWLTDGTIEYQGRNDNQVKIRGFRIELGEIALALQGIDGVKMPSLLL